jgi:hypothetical protein
MSLNYTVDRTTIDLDRRSLAVRKFLDLAEKLVLVAREAHAGFAR